MSPRDEIIRTNLRRLIEDHGLSITELAQKVFPNLSITAGRKRFERALHTGWVQRDMADGLIELWDIDLAELYLPINPKLTVLHMKKMGMESATRALSFAMGGPDYRMMQARLRTFGRTLNGREAEVFSERLVAAHPIPLKDLGDRWGVSRERARQVEQHMVSRLRRFLVLPALA